jgi:hypothetical protein
VDNSGNKIDDLGFAEFDRFTAMYRRAMEARSLSQIGIAKVVYEKLGYEDWQGAQSRLSRFLSGSVHWPPEHLKIWMRPLELSKRDYALMYRRGMEEFAPPYVQEMIANFAAAYRNILEGHSVQPLNDVLAGIAPRR